MTGRELLNSLDNKHLALAIVAIADAYPEIVLRLLMDEDIRNTFSGQGKNGIMNLKASYTYTMLTTEVDERFVDLIESIVDDDIAEA